MSADKVPATKKKSQSKQPTYKKKRKSTVSLTGQIEKFLDSMDDPDYWRKFTDPKTGEKITLTSEDIQIIRKLKENQYADEEYDPFQPSVDFFTYKVQKEPVLSRKRKSKSKNVSSKWEAKKIAKILKAIRRGIIDPQAILHPELEHNNKTRPVYDMWSAEASDKFKDIKTPSLPPIHAPRMRLPDHRESYNPPPEYLPTPEEQAEWEAKDPDHRPPFLPKRYSSLRLLPAYSELVRERFSRCLDLYMCPRAIRQKFAITDADDLLPTLPDPRDLRPFPNTKSMTFSGHTNTLLSISIDPSGQWMLTGARDDTVRLWEVASGQCLRTWSADSPHVSWNPNPLIPLFAMSSGDELKIVVPPGIPGATQAEQLLSSYNPGQWTSVVEWNSSKSEDGTRLTVKLAAPITGISWHRKGDYFTTLQANAAALAQRVSIHQLSKRVTQLPFKKLGGIPRSAAFHPTSPRFVIATERSVRVYDLSKQALSRKLFPSVRHISGLSIHPSGDHILISSLDGVVQWFDLDGSDTPFRSLQQPSPVRSVSFSPRFPLFATALDNGNLQITHATVFEDLRKDPLIIPVKIITCDHPLTTTCWHPTQPWLFAGAVDGTISLYV